jgi:hypothetical protein
MWHDPKRIAEENKAENDRRLADPKWVERKNAKRALKDASKGSPVEPEIKMSRPDKHDKRKPMNAPVEGGNRHARRKVAPKPIRASKPALDAPFEDGKWNKRFLARAARV